MSPRSEPDPRRVTVSVVVPAFREERVVAPALRALRDLGPDEIFLVDASDDDGRTLANARAVADEPHPVPVQVLRAPRGRAAQQNAGAARARGEILLFLHADCRLPTGAIRHLRAFRARHPKIHAGCFNARVDDPDPRFRLVDAAARLRAGLLGVPYGDQAIWVARDVFQSLGGFPPVPFMEDVLLSLRLRTLGRVAVLAPVLAVSPRRWRARGLLRQTLLNWTLTALAALGVPPENLAPHYPPAPEPDRTPPCPPFRRAPLDSTPPDH